MPADLNFKPETDNSTDFGFTSVHYSEKADFLRWHNEKYGTATLSEPEKSVTVKTQCYERPEGLSEELYPLPFVKSYHYTAILPYA